MRRAPIWPPGSSRSRWPRPRMPLAGCRPGPASKARTLSGREPPRPKCEPQRQSPDPRLDRGSVRDPAPRNCHRPQNSPARNRWRRSTSPTHMTWPNSADRARKCPQRDPSDNAQVTVVHGCFAPRKLWSTPQIRADQDPGKCYRSHRTPFRRPKSGAGHTFGRSSRCQVRHSFRKGSVKPLHILYRFVIAAGMGNPQASRIRS